MSETVNTREIVMNILLEVTRDGKELNQAAGDWLAKYQYIDARDRHFISRLSKATLEHMLWIDKILNAYSSVKVNKMKPVIRTILRMGVCQMLYMDGVPDHAICNESVNLAVRKGFKGLKGFVNGVLRSVMRKKDVLDELIPDQDKDPSGYISIKYSLPLWLTDMWLQMYGMEKTEKMAVAFGQDVDTTLRINTVKAAPSDMKKQLEKAGIKVEMHPYTDQVLKISGYDYLPEVTGFSEGCFWVQDVSSVLSGLCIDIKPGMKVLDLCGAPGGKSLNAAALMGNQGQIICRDVSPYKIDRIQENIDRTGLDCIEAGCGDATVPDESLFECMDVVIADVPCSGLGVIGKKTDIKYNMTPEKIQSLVTLQREILDVAWRYLKPGGVLLFSTCTVNQAENEAQVQWMTEYLPLKTESLNAYLPEMLHSPETASGRLQLMPGCHESDGFFMARLRREV